MKFKKRYIIILAIIFIIFCLLYLNTGFLQLSKIDNRDLKSWNFSSDGVILNAQEIRLIGKNETCWLLLHGYTSTPQELSELANRLNKEFNETVIVPRYYGHGEVPSKILNLTIENWYSQIASEFEELQNNCEKVNIVGFSFGGAIATKIAEEEKVNNLYLIAPYFKATYNPFRIFKSEFYLDIFANIISYTKKSKIGQINSKEGLEKHISYWNMPLEPVKYSSKFFKETLNNVNKISEPILIQHSINDKVASFSCSKVIFKNINSTKRDLIQFTKSNHILLEDFDKLDVIKNIINFENNLRRL